MVGYIFGGKDMPKSAQELKRLRATAAALAPSRTPQNVGEGLNAVGEAILYRSLMRDADQGEAAGTNAANNAFTALMRGGMGGAAPSMDAAPSAEPVAAPPGTMAPNQPPVPGLNRAPSEMTPYRDAIASIESAGSGDYSAIGPTHPKMGRALGRYQIMESNIGPWSKEAIGREVTPEEFMANPELQDAIFDGKFGSYVSKYGPEGAAQAWLGGEGGVGKVGRKDSLGTSIGEYGNRFSKALAGRGPVEVAQAAPQRQGIMSALMGGPQPTASDMPADYFPPAPSQGGGIDMMQAQELLGNEFLPQGRRAALEALVASEQQRQQMAQEQQMKQSDPAYQLGLQKTQLELERLRNPDADFITGRDGAIFRADKRKGTVEQVYGGKPDKPTDVQEYEYAKEQGFPGTFTDFQQQMKRAGASQVNIDQKAEGAFDKKLAEKQAESLDAMATEGMNAKADLAVIGELSTLMQGRGGTLDGFSGALAKYGIGGEGVGDIQAAQALINRLVPTQRQPGSGSMSDRDVEMFTRSLPSLWNQPGGNERILATMQGLAQYKQAQGDIAQRVMTGEISRQDATKALRELPNPLEAFRSAKPATQPEPAAQPAPAAPQAAPAGEPSIDDLLKMYGK